MRREGGEGECAVAVVAVEAVGSRLLWRAEVGQVEIDPTVAVEVTPRLAGDLLVANARPLDAGGVGHFDEGRRDLSLLLCPRRAAPQADHDDGRQG